ncbi:Transcriptional regulator ClgR [BD1-7 clade bacterium]|uniref:Transcriptional regulator ClgR n=1 Tax=BD1-7 clade bacterium TaxID=2029982 RepID=A0A5S9MSE8_9GAMM|nr:Transcriptional regulator ClgR [BD1-7 clade bacterium]CAA0084611.1 Transcriptional regulator ClgR [BD1-7 clade bacterium]
MISEEYITNIGIVIREMRAAKGLTQVELAEAAGLSRTYLTMVENGSRNAHIKNLVLIATALGVPVSELFKKAEEKHVV